MEMIQFKTRVVNLDSRPERWKKIPPEMDKIGITDYERFSAFENGSAGSVKSHIEVLKNVSGNLLVCEDDVCFIDQAREIFELAVSELPEDWDMLYLGANPKIPQIRHSDHLFKSEGGVHTNHAILYTEKARNYVFANYDYNTMDYYDHWLFMVGQKVMNVFLVSPMIAWQSPGYSDCRRDYMDYYLHMRSNEIRHMI